MNPDLPLVYCEHGALSKDLRALDASGRIKLIHFPHDPDSRSRRTDLTAPAAPAWSQGNVSWAEVYQLNQSWTDLQNRGRLDEILAIIGQSHQQDAQHLEAARRAGVIAFVTQDSDILTHAAALNSMLGFAIFSAADAPEGIGALLDR